MESVCKKEKSAIRFYVKGVIYRIENSDIVYMESLNRQLLVHTVNGVLMVPYGRLCECVEKDGENLMQCHRSLLVNPHFIREIRIRTRQIVLSEPWGMIAIGRKYQDEVKRLFDTGGIWRYTVH